VIVTVTPNPTLDRTYHVDELRLGELHRADYNAVEASGKGVNVSRVLLGLGVPTIAVLPLGGREGNEIAGLLTAAGLDHRAVRVRGAARVNITITEPGGRTTKVNGPGEPMTGEEQDALVRKAGQAASESRAEWLAICGSLPPGTGSDLVVRLIHAAHSAGARVAVDTSGAALAAALMAGADLVKPNREELAELTGRALPAIRDVAAAAMELTGAGATVLATVGAEGAVLVDRDRCLWAAAPSIEPVNTAGAGDTLLAGYLGSGLDDPEGRLAEAVALGTSACLTKGTVERPGRSISPADITVRRLDRDKTSGASKENPATGKAAGETRRSS